jgi:hypothetical protein
LWQLSNKNAWYPNINFMQYVQAMTHLRSTALQNIDVHRSLHIRIASKTLMDPMFFKGGRSMYPNDRFLVRYVVSTVLIEPREERVLHRGRASSLERGLSVV